MAAGVLLARVGTWLGATDVDDVGRAREQALAEVARWLRDVTAVLDRQWLAECVVAGRGWPSVDAPPGRGLTRHAPRPGIVPGRGA